MKTALLLLSLALLPFTAHASSLGKVEAALKKTNSSGKIIKIYGTNSYGVDLADGSNVESDLEAQVMANHICDLSKNWQSESDTIRCIAK